MDIKFVPASPEEMARRKPAEPKPAPRRRAPAKPKE